MKRFLPLVLLFSSLLAACGGNAGDPAAAFDPKADSVKRVEAQIQKEEEEFQALVNTDSNLTLSRAQFLDIEEGDRLNLLVKDDSGNMRRFFIDPTMPMEEWKRIQHPSNRGHWLQLLWHRRYIPPSQDSLPGIWVDEVVSLRKEKRP